jgi:subtilisin family serine protease
MTRSRTAIRFVFTGTLVALIFIAPASIRLRADAEEALIVQCTRPCAAVVAAVSLMGGQVTYQYESIDAVAVRIPKTHVADLALITGATAISKDVEVAGPRPIDTFDASQPDAVVDWRDAAVASAQPENYNYNNTLTGAASLHAAGKIGAGTIVALIDTGTANVAAVSPLTGSIIGGESFVPAATDPLSATSGRNGWHGTATGEMIAAHGAFVFSNASVFVRSLRARAPASVIQCPGPPFTPPCSATNSIIPMTGTAPGAKLYAMKVFQASGGGSPESRIIAAMDRAITLRRNFNSGMPSAPVSGDGSETNPFVYNSLKVDVVNMSLGGPTLFAGRDVEDQLTLAMLAAGITIVTSAGNDGFAAMTGGSPGTGFGSLTVGAATTAVHEGVLRDNQFGLAVGALYRPTRHLQMAYFSSRGPTADGRIDPDISANGFADYVQVMAAAGGLDCQDPAANPASCQPRILFVSGTSFSSPTVAGAAALLRKESPGSSATQIRNALQFSANPALFGDNSGPIDRGNGFLDVPAALAALNAGTVSDSLPDLEHHHSHGNDDDAGDDLGKGGQSVTRNVMDAGFEPIRFVQDRFTKRVSNLKPGQVAQFFVPSDAFTTRLTVQITGITPELPPAQQNQLFGDDIFYAIVDAPTSLAVDRVTRPSPFTAVDVTEVVDNPQTGLVRVALQGDWTNAGRISATVTISRERSFGVLPSAVGSIEQDEVIPFEVDVPSGAASLVFEAAWLQNWSRYPTNDLDLILLAPDGSAINGGATLNSPERVEIASPMPGRWTAILVGFTIYRNDGKPEDPSTEDGRTEAFTLTATADGVTLKARR